MNRYSIASALLEKRKTSRYSPAAFANFIESAAVNKFNRDGGKTALIFSDYSVLLIDNKTHNVESIDDVMCGLFEIIARLIQYQSNPADIPAYLCRDLREWLHQHG